MRYDCLTPEEKRRYEALKRDRDQHSGEMECAYDIVRAAMELFEEPDLRTLKNAMYFAHYFVNEELDELEEEAKELGLDVWMAKQAEDDRLKEQERLEREECEREEQEELHRLDAQWSQYDSDVA